LWRIDEVFDSPDSEPSDLNQHVEQRSKKQKRYMYLLFALTVILAVFSMGLGSSKSLNFWVIVKIIFGIEEPTSIQSNILVNIRLPRVLMAIFAGAALATAGTLMQGSLGNLWFHSNAWCGIGGFIRSGASNNTGFFRY